MNMTFALLARFNTPAVPLKDICQEFLGITYKTAEQKAKACDLPFPTFKTRDSERSPTLVNVSDLGDFLNQQYSQARKEWESVNS
ncbi:pyocin activator PrtN family protein [Thalassotalea sp. 1_MG-2023]|uniref:pyocin activator PrtN family protein n=1 Tax=Thalassotalea sp. 1_MG-2023 TaxID=3062680 RepID=UPI0026E1D71E|nr:pyocin activator PrtN family protein [Thalassotalea sp. 1_MG-2023]MDO6426199.1 pyocin activator PrtN family protein [Thalassotalea sp. 1_MG-2023]